MGTFSKETRVLRSFFYQIFTNKKTAVPIITTICSILYLYRYRNERLRKSLISSMEQIKMKKLMKQRKKRGHISKEALRRLYKLLKLSNPKLFSKLSFELFAMMIALILRTVLSIVIASVNGSLVKSIMSRDLKEFIMKILKMCVIAIPASFINSYINYLKKSIEFRVRENLTDYFDDRYISNLRFYQVVNIDERIKNPDQIITKDIEKFAESFANLYTNIIKPVLDVVLFSKSLSDKIGFKTVSLSFFWYALSGLLIKLVSPPMSLLVEQIQSLEGEYRAQQANIKGFSQEIAFLEGQKWENQLLDKKFDKLYQAKKDILHKRLFMGTFDSLLTRYGATLVGYFILAKPTMQFMGATNDGNSLQNITGDYIRNGSLMINLAKAIGRIVISYKDVQNIVGYTQSLNSLIEVLDDLDQGKYVRELTTDQAGFTKHEMQNRGKLIVTDNKQIRIDNVMVVTPNGNMLIEKLNLLLKNKENLIISGPNGCGKSSLFRVLGNLWPLISGEIERPPIEDLFYLPQRPYISEGSLMDQVLYPIHEKTEINTDKIIKWMKFVKLDNLLQEGNEKESLKQEKDWKKVLSEGEKQRIAMARLLYHKPLFAILDECSSRVSADMEQRFYNKTKEEGISLFTIAHRVSLFKYHDKYLKIEKGTGQWELIELTQDELNKIENDHSNSEDSDVQQLNLIRSYITVQNISK